MKKQRYIIVGGAGFIGSHFTDTLLDGNLAENMRIYDNFSSGKAWHYAHHADDPRLEVIEADVHELDRLTQAMQGCDTVIHLASNPDIAAAVADPDIDFREGTELTRNVVEAVRKSSVKTVLYASGSGIYGELGELEAAESYGPLYPISTYGASKLAGETLISSYAYMYDFKGRAFRFGNVVGRRQTHGVGFDFTRRLLDDPSQLRILGDGKQSKSYIHVSDIIRAVLGVHENDAPEYFEAYNVATGDYITVNEIARIACEVCGITPETVHFEHTGGDRGWKGDVPIVRLNTDKIRATGWRCEKTSAQALAASMSAMVKDLRGGKS